MKKVLVCALAVFFLMASCSTAFAATANSVTTYNSGDTSKFTVTTTVTDVTSGDKVTYLAYKNAKSTDSVTYADQQTAGGDAVKFMFDATPADVAVTTVQVGTSAATAITPATDALSDNVRKVYVTVNGGAATEVILPSSATENSFFYITGISIDSSKVVDCAKIASTEIAAMSGDNNTIIIADDALITNGVTIDLQLRAVSSETIEISNVKSVKFNNGTLDVLTVYAKVTGINTQEYGIELATDASGSDAEKYQAVAMGSDGSFAVQIQDENNGLVETTYYARVYAGSKTSEYALVPAAE